jgi:heat shock protein HtpX
MSAPKIGLQSQIWNNNIKSVLMLLSYPLIIIALVYAVSYVIAYGAGGYHMVGSQTPDGYEWINTGNPERVAGNIISDYWPIILAVITIWFIIAYFFNTAMIRKLSHSHPVERKDEPELYNLLENLCIAKGMTMPRLEIIETHARNAFASGIDNKSYAVTVTRGLMNSLTKDELEGVLAHELTHIVNRDVRLLIITVIFTGMIGFAAQMVWSHIRYGYIYSGSRRDKGNGAIVLLAIAAVLWIGYLATLFTRFAISRRREFMADAGAVQMTKNPEAMMRALQRIAGRDHIPQTTDDIAMMCIENASPFMGLFATHPPIESRIRAIADMTGATIPSVSLPPAGKGERFQSNTESKGEFVNPWLARARRR